MNRRTFLTTTTAIVGGISIAGCTSDTEFEDGDGGDGNNSGDGGGSNDGGSGSDEKLKILDHELVREDAGKSYETVEVVGTAENVSGDTLGYAEVKAKFYDANEALLDSSLDNVNDLGAGEKWSFEIMYLAMGEEAAEVASYKIGAGSNF